MKAMDRLMRDQEKGVGVGESQLGPESPEPPQLAFLQKPGIPQWASGGSTDWEASGCPELWWDGCSPGQQGGEVVRGGRVWVDRG